ncbi:MAG: LysO family transporter [Desulfitobacteriaceae bacterium]
MLEVLVYLLIGVALGWRGWSPQKILSSSQMVTLGVFFLLLTMGVKIGSDREILRQLGFYGLQAFLFALLTVVASLVLVGVFERLFVRGSVFSGEASLNVSMSAHPYRLTGLILLALIMGILLGLSVFPQAARIYLTRLTNGALYFTLFAVGLGLGANREVFKQILRLGWHVFLAPLGVALASVVSGMVLGKLMGWTWLEGGAVGAGFGWYSLSGVLITQLHSVALGTIAFLTNVFREVLAIILIPMLARRVGILSLVAPGGATTMDTTLPLIVSVGPPGVATVALVNGVCLSVLVPVLVPLLLS